MTRYVPDEWIKKNNKIFEGCTLQHKLRRLADALDEADALEKLYYAARDPKKRNELFCKLNGLGNFIEDDLKLAILVEFEEVLPESWEPKPPIRRKKVK